MDLEFILCIINKSIIFGATGLIAFSSLLFLFDDEIVNRKIRKKEEMINEIIMSNYRMYDGLMGDSISKEKLYAYVIKASLNDIKTLFKNKFFSDNREYILEYVIVHVENIIR